MCWGHRTQQRGALGGGRWVAKVRESYKQPSRTRAFYHPKSQGWFSSLFLFLWPQELACHLRRTSQMPSSPPTEGHPGTLPVCCSSRLSRKRQTFSRLVTARDIKMETVKPFQVRTNWWKNVTGIFDTKDQRKSSTFRELSRQLWWMLPPRAGTGILAEGQPGAFGSGWRSWAVWGRVRAGQAAGVPYPFFRFS